VRRYDVRRGTPPPLGRELRILAGCLWHVVRRRCTNGLVMAAHSVGRVRETIAPSPPLAPREHFLSGESGEVGGRRGRLLALADHALDLRAASRLIGPRLALRAARAPRRRVLVAGIDRPELEGCMETTIAELRRSRHDLTFAIAALDELRPGAGKFQNLNQILAGRDMGAYDWLLVVDDDVTLPRGFLDRFLFLAERFDLRLAQPAHRRHSHAAWRVTRRHGGSIVRETSFVEIGPVTAFRRDTFDVLLPFPDLRMGWGLDLHWAAVGRERGWRLGVVDALPVLHAVRPVAASYNRDNAVAEARAFLAGVPHLTNDEAQRTLVTHRSWGR
jgi:hypothetical protein